MPSAHRRYRDWTHERIRHEAQAVGPDTAVLVDVILRSRPHPEQGFRSCVGILRLVKRYGAERVDAACARALGARQPSTADRGPGERRRVTRIAPDRLLEEMERLGDLR
jgi:transposase